MRLLAIDQSAVNGSAALIEDGGVVAEREWKNDRSRNGRFMLLISDFLAGMSLGFGDLDAYAAGLGPGSFSGLRISVSALRGLALPDAKPVYGVSSARALALDILEETGSSTVAVIGDARRQHLWVAVFSGRDGIPEPESPIMPVRRDALAAHLPPGTTVAGPDWTRLNGLSADIPAGCRAIEEDRLPRAAAVGMLASLRRNDGEIRVARQPGDILSPIYLHPPTARPPVPPAGRRQQVDVTAAQKQSAGRPS